eukprot:Clim_evm68s109 gene=Clim_evmTU68s109
MLAGLLFFGLTMGTGSQTPGEENCDLVQVAVSENKSKVLDTRYKRLLVLLQILAPYVVETGLDEIIARYSRWVSARASAEFRDEDADLDLDLHDRIPKVHQLILSGLKYCKTLIATLHRLHISVFYLTGDYFYISRRLLGVRYVSLRDPKELAQRPRYTILGVLSFAQLLISVGVYAREQIKQSILRRQKQQKKQTGGIVGKDSDSNGQGIEDVCNESKRQCILCLSNMKNSTMTVCGHVFCWNCIAGWASEKPECPLCRTHIRLNSLFPLYNY